MKSSDSRPFLVTGAAGFLGSHLTFGLLERGLPVVALARADGERSALDRLEAAAGPLDWQGEWPPRKLTVVETDLDEPWLGLGPVEATTLLRRCREVIHTAARVDFSESQRERTFRTNAWSLAAWLPLLRRTRTPFNLVSTAYVAGRGVDVAREEPVCDPQCRNPYEASKVAAERWVFDDLAPLGVPWRIFRPSIVVGEAATGRATRFSTVYVLWELLDGLRRSVLDRGDGETSPVRLRIACDPRASLALVPVDYVVDAMRALLLRPATVGGIYHLTPDAPPSLDRLGRWMASAFAPLAPEAASAESFEAEPADGRERLPARGLGVYEPYLYCRTRFDTYHVRRALHGTGVRVPTVDETVWSRCLTYARGVDWGRSPSRPRSVPDRSSRGSRRDEAEIFFDVHLASWMGDLLLPGASSLTSIFEVELTDLPGFVRSVEVGDGRLVRVAGARSDAACRYELDSRTFRRIASGRLDPREAFFKRQTEIRGDVEAGLAVATWMIEFFRRHPLARHGAPSSWVS